MRFHTDDRISLFIEIGGSAENFNSYRRFLDLLGLAQQGFAAKVLE
jgi:hypothetical protein